MLITGRRDPLDQRPSWPFEINWDSPQAQGLELLVTFARGSNSTIVLGPGVNGNSVVAANGGGTRAHPEGGLGIDMTASPGTFASVSYFDAPFISAQGLTIVWFGVVDTGTGTFRHFAGMHAGNGAANNPFDFRTASATNLMRLTRAHATGFWTYEGSSVVVGEYHAYGVRVADNLTQTVPDFFVDGTKTAGTNIVSATNGAVTGSNAVIRIGRRMDDAVQMDGFCNEVRFYNRAIPDAHIAAMNDPRGRLDLYWRPTRSFFLLAAGGGGASTFPALTVAI